MDHKGKRILSCCEVFLGGGFFYMCKLFGMIFRTVVDGISGYQV